MKLLVNSLLISLLSFTGVSYSKDIYSEIPVKDLVISNGEKFILLRSDVNWNAVCLEIQDKFVCENPKPVPLNSVPRCIQDYPLPRCDNLAHLPLSRIVVDSNNPLYVRKKWHSWSYVRSCVFIANKTICQP